MSADLAAWLLEQIQTDEDTARAACLHPIETPQGDTWTISPGTVTDVIRITERPAVREFVAALAHRGGRHIALHDPARVLAECEAKRAIVALHGEFEYAYYVGGALVKHGYCQTCTDWNEPNDDGAPTTPHPCPTLRLLAQPYADRPAFREEWRA